MPRNKDIKKVLVIGSGPIIIGQAAEFDYAGTQAQMCIRDSGKDDLVDKLQYYEAGETIEVVISRANSGEYKEQTVEVTLGSKPSSDK